MLKLPFSPDFLSPMKPAAPEIFQIPTSQFQSVSKPGSAEFEMAAMAHYAAEYANKGWTAVVTVDPEFIRVVALPQGGIEPKAYVLGLLQNGFLEDALPILEALDGMIDDADIAFNHGICLSELGRVAESVAPLERAIGIDPKYVNAYVGLGFSYTKLGRDDDALAALRQAIALDPENSFAKRNYAAVLGRTGKLQEALPYFRQAASLAPNDPGVLLGLAQCLDDLGGDYRKEADKVYEQIAKRFSGHPVAEIALQGRTKIAQANLRAASGGNLRMDAVFYMQGAMDMFAGMPKERIGKIVMEIAHLGQGGLKINEPEVRYTLANLDGDFSGLQLLSLMHTGFRLFDPNSDTGTGLDREYEAAVAMRSKA